MKGGGREENGVDGDISYNKKQDDTIEFKVIHGATDTNRADFKRRRE